jgi:hypothetical protein
MSIALLMQDYKPHLQAIRGGCLGFDLFAALADRQFELNFVSQKIPNTMSGRYSNQNRLKAQVLLCTCFILVFIVLVMVINHQSNPYHHSDHHSDLEANLLMTSNHVDMVLPISRNNQDTIGKYLTRQRQDNKYNLMEEVGFVKFKQFLGGNKCNLGELSSWKTV